MKKILLIPSLLTVGLAPMVSMISCNNGVKPKDITVNKTKLNLAVGETAQLTATVEPAEASQEVEWSSSNPDVCTVDNGKVKAISAGKANITVKPKGYEIPAVCIVNVVLLPNNVIIDQYNPNYWGGIGCIMTNQKRVYTPNQRYLFDITCCFPGDYDKGEYYELSLSKDGLDGRDDDFYPTINKIYVNDVENLVQEQYYWSNESGVSIDNIECPQMVSLRNSDHIFIDLNIANIEQIEFYWTFCGFYD